MSWRTCGSPGIGCSTRCSSGGAGEVLLRLPEVLNLFRRHPQTNTHQVLRKDAFVEEILYVRARNSWKTFPISIERHLLLSGPIRPPSTTT